MAERVVVRIEEYLAMRKLREDLSYWRRKQRKAYETEASAQVRRHCAREISRIHDMIDSHGKEQIEC